MHKITISKCITLVLMNILYSLFLNFVQLILPIVGLFNPKLKRFIINRKKIFHEIDYKFQSSKNNIWFHAASLGEYELAVPLILELKKKKNCKIILTFFSESGFKLDNRIKEVDQYLYLPIDTKSNAKKFIEKINPSISIFIKSEIWPNYLTLLKKKKIPTYLINGRFTDNDWYFSKINYFFGKHLKSFEKIFVQDYNSEKVLEKHGINNVINSGSTKVDRAIIQLSLDNTISKIEEIIKNRIVFVCGSTWAEDEAFIFKFLNETKKDDLICLLAPHDVSKSNIQRIEKNINVSFDKYSSEKIHSEIEILIIDTIGDLKKLYSYADLSYIGGGMGTKGLHNILEACIFTNPVIIGKNYTEFIEAVNLVNLNGVNSISDYVEFKKTVDSLIESNDLRKEKKQIIENYINTNKGATNKILKNLKI